MLVSAQSICNFPQWKIEYSNRKMNETMAHLQFPSMEIEYSNREMNKTMVENGVERERNPMFGIMDSWEQEKEDLDIDLHPTLHHKSGETVKK